VIADFGAHGGRRLVITTPLTGWFSCAGERGTGVAVLLDVVGHLAGTVPVTVIGTTGHEIDGAGLRAALDTGSIPDGPILHLGASFAATGTDGTTLTDRWWCRSSATGSSFERIRRATKALSRTVEYTASGPTAEPGTWIGEAALWCHRVDLMCSIAGTFPRFHTPSDLPAVSTSPALLRDAIELARHLADILIGATHRRTG
jgi:hypothetical protein